LQGLNIFHVQADVQNNWHRANDKLAENVFLVSSGITLQHSIIDISSYVRMNDVYKDITQLVPDWQNS